MEIQISKELEPEVKSLVIALKFKSMEEFVNRVIREKILEIRKKRFIEITDRVAEGLRKKGIREEEIMVEFEKNRE